MAPFRAGTNATTGPIPGESLVLTATLGSSCVERRGATDITWGETLVAPSQAVVAQSARVDSATNLTLIEASFVRIRVTNGGWTGIGDTRSYPPSAADLARADNPDWSHRLPVAGAQLEPGTLYMLVFGLHLAGADIPATLRGASVTFEAGGQRSSRAVVTNLRLPAEGVRCT